MEYFSYDKSFINPQGGWTSDKAIALAFGDQRSADQFKVRALPYVTTEVIRG
jgi:hypothetical protein